MIVLSSLDAQCAGSVQLASFRILSQEYVKSLIGKSSKKTCSLDPMPTPLVVECLDALLPVITRMINLSLQGGTFPDNWKLADVKLRLKKTGVDALFTNLRPISNLSFSKLTEKAVFAQLHKHLTTNKLYQHIVNSTAQKPPCYEWKTTYYSIWTNNVSLYSYF